MNVPHEMAGHAQWLLWKYIVRDGKETKCPFQVTGQVASSTNPATWSTLEDAMLPIDRYQGLGFVFTAEDPFIGIDLDGCRDPESGLLESWADAVHERFSDTYAEVSPSGTGIKIFCKTDTTWAGPNKCDAAAPAKFGKKPQIEVYQAGRFFCFTGQRYGDATEAIDATKAVEWLQAAMIQRTGQARVVVSGMTIQTPIAERARAYIAKMDPAVSGNGGHDQTFRVACVLKMGFAIDDGEALQLLREWNANCQPPWSERELAHKIKSAGNQPGARGYLAEAKPEQYDRIRLPGNYQEAKQEPPPEVPVIKTLESAAREYLQTLADGTQDLIQLGITSIDEAIGGGVAEGEMVIFAARPSHGKSAIALQIVHNVTAAGLPALFVSEEMSSLALGKRSIQFASDTREIAWQIRPSEVEADVDRHFRQRAPTYIIESTGTAERCKELVEQAIDTYGIKVVVIDYAQLLGSVKSKTEYEKYTETSKMLRRMASAKKIVAIVLVQLNRGIESRPAFIPTMSDIKGSGQFEQDADVIIGQVWPHKIDGSESKDRYCFYMMKNRNREIVNSFVECEFIPWRQKVVERVVVPVDSYAEFE
jgi:KaiC/GvpD/RAD55 family RecA-like ATPase